MMLTFVISGDSYLVTAEQFRTLIDVAVRMMRDAARSSGVSFTIAALHASAPTISREPQAIAADVDVDAEFDRIVQRLDDGIGMLEQDAGLPDWMAETTAGALYKAAALFGEGAIEGMVFARDTRHRKVTRRTYHTLDRVLHEKTDAIGSVTGVLVTATLNHGPHLTVKDDVYGRGVRWAVDKQTLRQAGQWIGERVTVAGHIKRDYLGRPDQVKNAKVDPLPELGRVTIDEMGGALEGGPESIGWLGEQRGR